MQRQEDQTDGMPTPEWSAQGTKAEIAPRMEGFQFGGQGWYVGTDRTMLVVPIDMTAGDVANSVFSGLIELFAGPPEGDDEDDDSTRYACYSWSGDPRAAIKQLLRLKDETPVPVPAELIAAWPTIRAQADELRAWAHAELAKMAAQKGVEWVEIEMICSTPDRLAKWQVVDQRGTMRYQFDAWLVHLMDLEHYEATAAHKRAEIASGGNRRLPPNVRLFRVGDVGVGLTFARP